MNRLSVSMILICLANLTSAQLNIPLAVSKCYHSPLDTVRFTPGEKMLNYDHLHQLDSLDFLEVFQHTLNEIDYDQTDYRVFPNHTFQFSHLPTYFYSYQGSEDAGCEFIAARILILQHDTLSHSLYLYEMFYVEELVAASTMSCYSRQKEIGKLTNYNFTTLAEYKSADKLEIFTVENRSERDSIWFHKHQLLNGVLSEVHYFSTNCCWAGVRDREMRFDEDGRLIFDSNGY